MSDSQNMQNTNVENANTVCSEKTAANMHGQNQLGMMPTEPNVLNFIDYREYLYAWWRWKKSATPQYSGAIFARKGGLSSHTIFGMVASGRRNLGISGLNSFIKALGLSGKRARYFERLVHYNQAKTTQEKENQLNELKQLSPGEKNIELKRLTDFSNYLSSWHLVAIRELVLLKSFNPDANWICKKLKNKISRKQAEQAWQILKDLELIRFDTEKNRYVTEEALEISPGKADFVIRNFHKQYLELAKKSVDEDPIDERDISSLTIAVSKDEISYIKNQLTEFRKGLNQHLSSSQKTKDHLIALNIQMLILTQSEKAQHEEESHVLKI